jgi:hypothetical protein
MNPITVWCPTCGGRGTVPVFTLVGFKLRGRTLTRKQQSALIVCETCEGCCTISVTPLAGPDDVAPALRDRPEPARPATFG